MGNKNYKLFLYRPAAANYAVDTSQHRAEFLGELKADNVSASIKLQEISTLSFTLPENILGQLNTRLDEVLDNYVVELWYGDLTGTTLGSDYFPTTGNRIRFIITTSNLQYTDGVKNYAFEANSIEYFLEFKQLLNWPGIKVKDFYRTITYNATNNDFEETDQTDYSISTSSNANGTKYITVSTTTAGTNPPSPFDIFIYQYRRNDDDTVNSENSIIEYTGGVNDAGFKPGFYVPTLNGSGKVTSIAISLPSDIEEFDAAGKNFEIFLYDNPTSRHFAIGINTDSEFNASDMYLDLAQDAEDGDTTQFNGFTFTTQEVYSINGLKLEHILLGTQDSRTSGNIDNSKLNIDGVLYDTGFTIGEINSDIAAKYRSNIELNNITKYEAIKNIAESFDAIAIFNTITKKVSFYPDKNEEVFTNNGLIITKDNYLKSISNNINSVKIVTKVYGAGKDNLGLELITPNGNAAWEDYSYFLDTYHVEYDSSNVLAMIADNNKGVFYESFPTGTLSRWIESSEALKLAQWQYARDYFHNVMLGNSTGEIAEYDNATTGRYYDLYNRRSASLNTFVKEETKYFELKATEYKYKYIYERYVKINKEGGDNETEIYEADYLIKYNNAVNASTSALSELNKLHYNLYNTRFNNSIAVSGDPDYSILSAIQANSYATKIAEVQGFLNKTEWEIDTTKLKAFEKEAVMTDSKLDNELDLLLAVQEFTKENCIPVITMDVDVVDFLATKDYSVDWNKAVIGEVVNIYYPDFNIDTTAQLREISIDFQANSLKFLISTYRQYGRLPLSYISRQIRLNYDNSSNLFKYTHDVSVVSNDRTTDINKKLNGAGFFAEEAPFKFGAKRPDGKTSTEISGEGFVSSVIGVDPVLESFTYEVTKTLKISDGALLARNVISETLVSEVEISGDSGLVIRKIESGVSTPQVSIDINGNAIFAGELDAATGTFSGSLVVGSDAYNQVVSLAGAGTTVFKAGDMSEINAITTANINDLLFVTATFTDTTPEPDRIYEKDDIYRYQLVTEPDTFDWVVLDEEFKNKINGSVGGWTINTTDIKSNNNTMVLHSDYSDSENNGVAPYISIAQPSIGYENEGIFLGRVLHSEDPDVYYPKLSLVNSDETNYLKWTGLELQVKGNITATSGSFSGVNIDGTLTMGSLGEISIDNGEVLINNNGINIGSGSITIDYANDGINASNGSFSLRLDGTGSIGGFSYGTDYLQAGTTSGNYLGMSPGAGTASNISFWAGAADNSDANISAAPFRVTNTGALTATNATISGNITIGQLIQAYNQNGIFLGTDSEVSKFSLVSDQTFMTFDPNATDYKLKISGEAKIGPLTLGEVGSTFADLTFTNHAKISNTGNILNATYTFGTQDVNGISIESDLGQSVSGGIGDREFYFEIYKDTNLLYTSTTISIPNFSGTSETLNFLIDISALEANKIITYVSGTAGASGTWTIIPSVLVTSARINLGNFSVDPNGAVTSKNIINNGTLTNTGAATFGNATNDRVIISGNSFTTPFTTTIQPLNLSDHRTLNLPDTDGTLLPSTFNDGLITDTTSSITGDIYIVARSSTTSNINIIASNNIKLKTVADTTGDIELNSIDNIELIAGDNVDLTAADKVDITSTNGTFIKRSATFLNNTEETRDGILILPNNVGSSSRRITLTTPSVPLTNNKTITLPDDTGTIALNKTTFLGRVTASTAGATEYTLSTSLLTSYSVLILTFIHYDGTRRNIASYAIPNEDFTGGSTRQATLATDSNDDNTFAHCRIRYITSTSVGVTFADAGTSALTYAEINGVL